MNQLNKPTNAFSDPAIPTLEQVRDRLATGYTIPHQRRMDMVSAINAIGKWLDLPLSIMPASAEFLRQKLKKREPPDPGRRQAAFPECQVARPGGTPPGRPFDQTGLLSDADERYVAGPL